jgi:hypothetical protein
MGSVALTSRHPLSTKVVTSPIGGCRSVGIFRSRTKATEFFLQCLTKHSVQTIVRSNQSPVHSVPGTICKVVGVEVDHSHQTSAEMEVYLRSPMCPHGIVLSYFSVGT